MAETASMSDLQLLPLDQPLLPAALARAFDIPQPGTSAAFGPGGGSSSAAPAPRVGASPTASAFAVPRQTPGAASAAAPAARQPAGGGGDPAGPTSWSSMTAALQAQQQQQRKQAQTQAQAHTQAQAQAQAQVQQPPAAPQAAAAVTATAGGAPFMPGPSSHGSAPFPHAGHPYLAAAGPGALPYNPYHSFPLMAGPGMAQAYNPYLGVMPPFPGGPGPHPANGIASHLCCSQPQRLDALRPQRLPSRTTFDPASRCCPVEVAELPSCGQ